MVTDHGQPARVPVGNCARRGGGDRRAGAAVIVQKVAAENGGILQPIGGVPSDVARGIGPTGLLLSGQDVIAVQAVNVAE